MEKFQKIKTSIHSETEYSIFAGHSFLSRTFLEENLRFGDYEVFVDSNVALLHANILSEIFPEKWESRIEIPSGESSKSMEQFSLLLDTLLRRGVTRKTTIFAIGGGVVGDLVGFVASATLRGLPLVHIPTTLLAMVDSSIGGKTGVNHSVGKNLIGSFYQPKAVFCDTQFLATLVESEFYSGMGEVVKYALLSGKADIERLVSEKPSMESSPEILSYWILHGIKSKVYFVENDEKESGIRAFLNLGHTYAHAIEACLGYGTIAHGEAVFWGLMAALKSSQLSGAPVSPEMLFPLKTFYGNTKFLTEDTIEEAISFMRMDKKVQQKNVIRLILLQHYGQAYPKDVSELDIVRQSWRYIIEQHSL